MKITFKILVLVLILVLAYTKSNSQKKIALSNQSIQLLFEHRAIDMVSKMTLDEKISQMQYEAPEIKRLNIPQYNWWNECLHGVARNGIATVFPQAIGMAATWNPELIKNEAEVIATEARAKYYDAVKKNQRNIYQGLTFWTPNINIFRDPRWGRGQETYGEDPYLTSRIGVSFVKGMQGDDPRFFKIISTPKHFAVHSGPESSRHTFDARTSKRDLYETYLPAFEACIKEAGAWSIMGAYNRYMGEACCASNFLLGDILRKKWGFKGYIVSDCGAIGDIYNGHKITNDAASACALAVKAGCDLTCGQEYVALKEAVQKGLITEKDIDVSVTRLMLARLKLGLFEPPQTAPFSNIPISANDTKENRQLAAKIARESMVLLKNSNNVLPIDKSKIKSIAVIGPNANEVDVLLGNYAGTPSKAFTVLEGIQLKTKDLRLTTNFAKGCDLFITPFHGESIPESIYKGGLKGEYFNNTTLEGTPVIVRRYNKIDFDWGDGTPDPKVNSDNFSARWTGKIVPVFTENYELTFKGNDGYRVYINNKLEIDGWSNHGRTEKSVQIRLESGKEYDLKIEYFENKFSASAQLFWNYPGALEKYNKEVEKKIKDEYDNALKIASKSDIIVFVGGISPELEGEEMEVNVPGFSGGDRTTLDLTQMQSKLLKDLNALGKPLILVLMNGSALAINWEKDNVPAILEAWYPGEEGGTAVADILFGDYNPAGRLPITFYKSVNDLPAFDNYDMKGRTYRYFNGKTLYSFGHGLSYSNFEYSNLKLSNSNIDSKGTVNINLDIKNTGNYDGDEVIQLYVKPSYILKIERSFLSTLPQKSLKAFTRINLKKGESKTVQLTLKAEDLKYFDEEKDDYIIVPGKYEIQLGASSDDIRLKDVLEVK